MSRHQPAVWLSGRYSAQQGYADRRQTYLVHLARDVAYVLDVDNDTLALRMKLWLDAALALARTTTTTAAPSTVTTERRKLESTLDDVLAAPATCNLARDIQNRMRRVRDQLLTFASFPGRVEAHKNACERDLSPAVIQHKDTNCYRAMWSGQGRGCGAHRCGHRVHDLRRRYIQRRAGHNRPLTTFSQAAHPVSQSDDRRQS